MDSSFVYVTFLKEKKSTLLNIAALCLENNTGKRSNFNIGNAICKIAGVEGGEGKGGGRGKQQRNSGNGEGRGMKQPKNIREKVDQIRQRMFEELKGLKSQYVLSGDQ